MADSSSVVLYYLSQPRSLRHFYFIPTTLALATSLLILFYISSTSNLFAHHHHHAHSIPQLLLNISSSYTPFRAEEAHLKADSAQVIKGQRSPEQPQLGSNGNYVNNNAVFHDRHIFLEDYKEMKRSFKIYVYPHRQDDSFANALLPVDSEPGGNYASESYFKKVLMKSHFITNDPSKADLFFLPFSIARLRHDPRIGVGGIQDFIRDYIFNVSHKYEYWNRTGGADHFYVACHSIGRSAMEKANEVKFNAIQVVCSSSYFLPGYIPHKDASLPQIWPRNEKPPDLRSSNR